MEAERSRVAKDLRARGAEALGGEVGLQRRRRRTAVEAQCPRPQADEVELLGGCIEMLAYIVRYDETPQKVVCVVARKD